MKKRLEEALKNLDLALSGMQLTRKQHIILADNLRLVGDLAREQINPSKKKKKKLTSKEK